MNLETAEKVASLVASLIVIVGAAAAFLRICYCVARRHAPRVYGWLALHTPPLLGKLFGFLEKHNLYFSGVALVLTIAFPPQYLSPLHQSAVVSLIIAAIVFNLTVKALTIRDATIESLIKSNEKLLSDLRDYDDHFDLVEDILWDLLYANRNSVEMMVTLERVLAESPNSKLSLHYRDWLESRN
jgi:hypothetical protein